MLWTADTAVDETEELLCTINHLAAVVELREKTFELF